MNIDATKIKECGEDGKMEVGGESEVKESSFIMVIQKKIPKTETLVRNM